MVSLLKLKIMPSTTTLNHNRYYLSLVSTPVSFRWTIPLMLISSLILYQKRGFLQQFETMSDIGLIWPMSDVGYRWYMYFSVLVPSYRHLYFFNLYIRKFEHVTTTSSYHKHFRMRCLGMLSHGNRQNADG